MSRPLWVDDPLKYLLGDIDPATFFSDYHERGPLVCRHGEPDRFRDLLSIERIDEVVASAELPPQALQMARHDPPLQREHFTHDNNNIDRGAVMRQYQLGATLILQQLHLGDATLGDFCRAVESVFSAYVQTNVYLTPPGNQGFRIHYDDHDVFVVQITGSKQWRLYGTPIANPYRGEAFRRDAHDPGEPVETFLLEAGDCAYIPRGLMHDAQTEGDEPSLHITVGIIVKTWADLMLESISEVALRHPQFRRSLPPGFARDEFDRDSAEATFRELVSAFSQEARFTPAFELFVDSFIREREPDVRGGILDGLRALTDSDRFRRRSNVQIVLTEEEEGLCIICAGGNLWFPPEARAGLDRMIAGDGVGLQDFADLPEDQARDSIRKLLAFGVAERSSDDI